MYILFGFGVKKHLGPVFGGFVPCDIDKDKTVDKRICHMHDSAGPLT